MTTEIERRLAPLSSAAQSLYRAGAFDPVSGGLAEHWELRDAGLIGQVDIPDDGSHLDAPPSVRVWRAVAL